MQFGKLVGDFIQKEGGAKALLQKVVDYCKSPDFVSQFGSQAEEFKKEAEEALSLAASGEDKEKMASLVEKMKATAKEAGDKVVPMAIRKLLENVKL
jgi:hypothetical protein